MQITPVCFQNESEQTVNVLMNQEILESYIPYL